MRLAHRPVHAPTSSSLGSDFDAFVTQVFGHDLAPASPRTAFDAYEDQDTVTLVADLPGYGRDQVNVTIDNDVLTVLAERPALTVGDEKTVWHLRERRGGRVERAFKLPSTIDAGSVDAKLADGVLTLTLKKRQEAKPRKVEIA